jgi:hypothetical protein
MSASVSSLWIVNGRLAAATVEHFRFKHAIGPTWSALAALMDWPANPETHGSIIENLAAEGWLDYTTEANSLRPGPRYEELAS